MKEHVNATQPEIHKLATNRIFVDNTHAKFGPLKKKQINNGSQPIKSQLSSTLALRAGLFPNESSPFPIQTQRLRCWKGQTAAQSLQDGVCWQPLEPLSYFSACSAFSHPTLYHTSALCCCSVHGFNSLVPLQRCPSRTQHCRFGPPAKFYSDVSEKDDEKQISIILMPVSAFLCNWFNWFSSGLQCSSFVD